MRFRSTVSIAALAAALASAPGLAQEADEAVEDERVQLDQIVVTTQRRETGLQDTSAAVAAFTGENIEEAAIFSYEDLASSVASLSFTALSPLDQEFNIRGITNTRLDSPSADQSVGIFIDEVYVGRSGLLNTDFFDIERVEVVRGPQGVLLGRNVVGGAISIITNEPQFEPGGELRASIGNFDSRLVTGHVTGPLVDNVAGRFSFQSRQRAGYNRDVLNDRDLDDLESLQFRGQLLYEAPGSDLRARLILDYMNDESNGFHTVAIDDPNADGAGPWSTTRAAIAAVRPGGLDIRESLPETVQYAGEDSPSQQGLSREATGLTLAIEKSIVDGVILNSTTGYRQGQAFNLYDQTGVGPDNGFGIFTPLAFQFPVNEDEEIKQFTQEVRLTSDYDDSLFDWILGGYYQNDDTSKFDRFFGEVPLTVLSTLSGESHWINDADVTSYAVFGQIGFRLTEQIRAVGGVRWTRDEKEGVITGVAVETGDKFNPDDPVALTPLSPEFAEGESFTAAYGESWSEVTPQFTVEWTPMENLLLYATYSRGYKGGGFEDTPANVAAAQFSYDPETADNIELGAKADFLDNRARLNVAAFTIDYKDLQV
ncbi:MAG: TonB-dependent receptor, partial [Caulobacterales bacterium]|nr:TonB-dependent receptor [Caulobacterales bacterium]